MDLPSAVADAGVFLSIAGGAALIAGLIYLKTEHRAHYGLSPYSDAGSDAMVNCPDCGARNDAERATCEHCSEPLAAEGPAGGDDEDGADVDRWGSDRQSE